MRDLFYRVVLVEMVDHEEDVWHTIDMVDNIESALNAKKIVDRHICKRSSLDYGGKSFTLLSKNQYMCIVIVEDQTK